MSTSDRTENVQGTGGPGGQQVPPVPTTAPDGYPPYDRDADRDGDDRRADPYGQEAAGGDLGRTVDPGHHGPDTVTPGRTDPADPADTDHPGAQHTGAPQHTTGGGVPGGLTKDAGTGHVDRTGPLGHTAQPSHTGQPSHTTQTSHISPTGGLFGSHGAGGQTSGSGHSGRGGLSAAGVVPEKDQHELTERIRHAVGGFVDAPREAVEEADALLGEVAERLSGMITERRRELRTSWQDGATDKSGTSGKRERDTEELRLALRGYRDVLERLLHV